MCQHYGRYYCSENKPIFYLDTVYCKFLLYVSVEIDPFSCDKHRQFSTQTNSVLRLCKCLYDYWDL